MQNSTHQAPNTSWMERDAFEGRHILYTFTERASYVDNLVQYIIEGIEKNEQVFCAEQMDVLNYISERLKQAGYTDEQLADVYLVEANRFYGVHDTFSVDYLNNSFAQSVFPYLDFSRDVRLWGTVVWQGGNEGISDEEIYSYEYAYDNLIAEKTNMLSVCGYDASTLSASLMNSLLETHEFHMMDRGLVRSHLYKKKR